MKRRKLALEAFVVRFLLAILLALVSQFAAAQATASYVEVNPYSTLHNSDYITASPGLNVLNPGPIKMNNGTFQVYATADSSAATFGVSSYLSTNQSSVGLQTEAYSIAKAYGTAVVKSNSASAEAGKVIFELDFHGSLGDAVNAGQGLQGFLSATATSGSTTTGIAEQLAFDGMSSTANALILTNMQQVIESGAGIQYFNDPYNMIVPSNIIGSNLVGHLQLEIPVHAGDSVDIQMGMEALTAVGNYALPASASVDGAHTGQLSVFLPAGFTFETTDGFLSGVLTAVPEPGTFGLMFFGIGVLTAATRRRNVGAL